MLTLEEKRLFLPVSFIPLKLVKILCVGIHGTTTGPHKTDGSSDGSYWNPQGPKRKELKWAVADIRR